MTVVCCLPSNIVLRLGIILYGFRLTFSQIADVGIGGIIIDVLTLSSTFLLACFLGQKVFGLDKHTSWLIGAGSSICGAAAVLATEPVVKAEASKVTMAVATVVIFGTVAIFLYPAIYSLMSQWFSPETFGVYSWFYCARSGAGGGGRSCHQPGCGKRSSYFQIVALDDASSVPHPAGGAC